ncbi:hypothetical protein [Streptomyces lunaelactis]|uniref:hypothetical protein n=1 Tax=Streptomyces lunaelactis TaxID=1535768 RepID=UPI0015847FDE|nr:hypothetical protein [Streptomyces lunaelactis]NUK21293.1 hypothetical protein [Streptomyces lunaelactis]
MNIIISREWAVLAAASALLSFPKTAVSGADTVGLAIFAAVLRARESLRPCSALCNSSCSSGSGSSRTSRCLRA